MKERWFGGGRRCLQKGIALLERPDGLQKFVDQLEGGFAVAAIDPPGRQMLDTAFSALKRVEISGGRKGERLAVCRYLDEVLDPSAFEGSGVSELAHSFAALEPGLVWRRRAGASEGASSGFQDGHANAIIVGPTGLEVRPDVTIGVTLLAPDVRYPDHTHRPEETYLVMSEGAFQNASTPWVSPGVGGTFHNEPEILHAMRSGTRPLLAFWVLWNGPQT